MNKEIRQVFEYGNRKFFSREDAEAAKKKDELSIRQQEETEDSAQKRLMVPTYKYSEFFSFCFFTSEYDHQTLSNYLNTLCQCKYIFRPMTPRTWYILEYDNTSDHLFVSTQPLEKYILSELTGIRGALDMILGLTPDIPCLEVFKSIIKICEAEAKKGGGG